MNLQRTTIVVTSLMLLLSGCGFINSSNRTTESPTSGETNGLSSQEQTQPPFVNPDQKEDATPVPENVQIYQDDSGMFALALPDTYTYEPTDQGMTFTSNDDGFAGEVVYQLDENATPNLYALEQQLKDIVEARFGDVDWEQSGQRQPDGSVRLAWEATDENGRAIDALSFIEVHGQNRFALMLYSVDKAYNDYSDDARIIAGTYVVRKGPAISNTDTTDADAEAEADAGTAANTES